MISFLLRIILKDYYIVKISDTIKTSFSKMKDIIKKTKFLKLTAKKRTGIIISSMLLSFYILICFGIIQVGTEEKQSVLRIISSSVLVFSFVFYVTNFLIHFKIKKRSYEKTGHLFLKVMLLCLAVMLVFYFAGGSFGTSADIEDQFNQAVTGNYNNWHPVVHTFLFYKIPMVIFGETISSVVMFQYLFIAAALAYFVWSMMKFGVRISIVIAFTALMLINETFRYIVKFPWKDIPFAFSMLVLTVNLMWIYFTKSEWLRKTSNIILFAISLLFVLFLRHNGILAILPTVFILFITYKNIRKHTLIIASSVLVLYFLITIPLYGILEIESHPQSFAESMGVPNNQISYIVKKQGNITTEEEEFLNNIMPIGVIWYHYEIGDYNSIKWRKNQAGTAYYYNGEFLQNHKEEYLKTWFSIIKRNPELAFEGYYSATLKLWESRLEIANGIDYSVGFGFFLATFMLAMAAFGDRKRWIAYIPMLFNMLGIMMLVTGGEIRFVFANLVCGLPIVMFAVVPKNTLELP